MFRDVRSSEPSRDATNRFAGLEKFRQPRSTLFNRTRITIGVVGALACSMLAYAGFSGFTAMRQDILSTATTERSLMEQSYEERIYQLRAQLDRLTSSQAVTQANLEEQMTALLQHQQTLRARHALVSDLVKRAERSGLPLAMTTPLPEKKPDLVPDDTNSTSHLLAIGGEPEPIEDPFAALGLRGSSAEVAPTAVQVKKKPQLNREEAAALKRLQSDLSAMEVESAAALEAISIAARKQRDDILAATAPLGVTMAKARKLAALDSPMMQAVGGPYEPLDETQMGTGFTFRAAQAEAALNDLDVLKSAVRKLPVETPARNAPISSPFGPRMDPFLGKLAMHTGIDFMAISGTSVHAAGPGVIIKAGRNGGYGNMVTIRHANGLVSRYAHLSRILVQKGEKVTGGEVIGRVGTTGRSTGPHLHFEIRRNGKPIDPSEYVKAGRDISAYL